MAIIRHFGLALLLFSRGYNHGGATLVDAFGISQSLKMTATAPKPRGCAATPLDKKKVAVFGGGGYMGANVFGYLQRAAAIYGTGIGGPYIPRCICASAASSESLNRVLSKSFKLAYASESMVKLTNMKSIDAISSRLKNFDAAILATGYQLERRPVTGNTYEITPNDKTWEFYMDKRKVGGMDIDNNEEEEEIQLSLFRNTIESCEIAGLDHVVVIETPRTTNARPYAEILDRSKLHFTYIHSLGELETCTDYTFERGIQSNLDIRGYTFSNTYTSEPGYNDGDWLDALSDVRLLAELTDYGVNREDIAAVAVQALLSLDWNRSRCLEISSSGKLESDSAAAYGMAGKYQIIRTDRDWCVNSQLIAEKLSPIN